MSLDKASLGKVMRVLGRRACLYAVDLEQSQPGRVVFWSSRAMPMVSSTKSGPEIYWDERFFQFARHAFRAISDPDRRIQLPTSQSVASLHLEAVIWCALAERALNPGGPDVELAMGIVLQSSMFLHHSMKVLGPFDESFEEDEGVTQARMGIFQQFVEHHELSHYAIKAGRRPSDDMLTNVGVAMRLIDGRLAELKARGAHPHMIELFQFASEARADGLIMEEIWADTMAVEEMLKWMPATEIGKQLTNSLIFWLISQGALYGLTALRFLGLVNALSARSQTSFEKIWNEQRRQFIAREVYLRTILSSVISRSNEDPEVSHEDQLRRMSELSHKLYEQTNIAEVDWLERWTIGRLDELRQEGREAMQSRGWNASRAATFCGERLGWFRGRRLSSPATDVLEALSEEDAREIAKRGHLVHMVRAKTVEERTAFYFILVSPEKEQAFLDALAGADEMDLMMYGRIIASNYGDKPSLEVLAYVSERFGFEVPEHAALGQAADDQQGCTDADTAVTVLQGYAARSRRAVMVFAIAALAEKSLAAGRHHLSLTFNTRFDGISMPDWLLERYPEKMTISLQNNFQDLEYNDVAFEVGMTFNGRAARLRVPYLAVSRFSDTSFSIHLIFPGAEESVLQAEQDFLESAIGQVGLDLLSTQIDYATIEQRAHRAALISLMRLLSAGAAVPKGDRFVFELDPGAMVSGMPDGWRAADGRVFLQVEGLPPRILEEGAPVSWRIQPADSNEVVIPVRAVMRLQALSGKADAELVFNLPGLDRQRPH